MSDERIDRLPKWARDRIKLLEGTIHNLQQRVAIMANEHPGSPVMARPYGEPPQTLDPHDVIRFRVGERHDDYIDVRLDGTKVRIMAGRQLVIHPNVTNVITVENVP